MAYQLSAVSLLMFGAATLMLISAAVAYQNRAVPGAVPFTVFISCSALWALTYGLQLLFTSLERQLFFDATTYPFGLFTCVTFGVFVVHYTGRDHRLTTPRLLAASALPALTSITVWLPDYEWLVREEAALVAVNGILVADISFGPLFNVAVAYSYLVVLGSLGLLGVTTLRTRQLYQKQTLLITVAAFVPLVGGAVAYVFGITVIDYTPVGLAVLGVGVAVALTRYQLLDVYPVPRNRIIAQIDTGIVVTDATDRIVDINPAATAIVGSADMIGRQLGDSGGPGAEMAAMAAGTTTEVSDGESAYYECQKSTLDTEGGFGDTQLYILTDVTERRRRQDALEAKNDRLDSCAAVLSHDLRNPLSVADGTAELARTDPSDEHFDRIDRAHNRISEIIDDMLTLARSGDTVSDPGVVDLESVATDAWRNVATDGADLVVEETRQLRADPRRLKQLFENLFRNSVEHGSMSDRTESTDGIGHTGPDEDATVSIRLGPTGAGFFLADDGPGIPVEERDAVFRSGVSSEEDGTGVGLSIVQTVVDGHDWEITATESESGGARFDIET